MSRDLRYLPEVLEIISVKDGLYKIRASQVAPVVRNPPANAGDVGSISGLGRSPGGGHGNPLQYCSLENLMDKGARWALVYRVAKSWTRLKQLGMHAVRENIQEIDFIKNSKYVICIESKNSKRSSSVGSLQQKKILLTMTGLVFNILRDFTI